MNSLWKKATQYGAILLVCGLISACTGFHLRTEAQISAPELRALRVTGDPEWIEAMRKPLREAGVLIVDKPGYQLQLIDYQTHQQVYGYQGGSVGQYTLTGTLTWALATFDGKVILGPRTQTGQRDYDFDRNATSVSGMVQMNTFSNAVFQDLAQQMISQLAALSSADLIARQRQSPHPVRRKKPTKMPPHLSH